jgi:hypothetical protein
MIRAILAGAKSQTRRVVKPGSGQDWIKPETLSAVRRFAPSVGEWWTMAVGEESRIEIGGHEIDGGHIGSIKCPYGHPGDVLWVRETWDYSYHVTQKPISAIDSPADFEYKAELTNGPRLNDKWKSPIHMPRVACRLFLRITDVRVERLQDITPEDSIAEGIGLETIQNQTLYTDYLNDGFARPDPRMSYASLWEKINGPGSWEANPFVWVLSFERVENPYTLPESAIWNMNIGSGGEE